MDLSRNELDSLEKDMGLVVAAFPSRHRETTMEKKWAVVVTHPGTGKIFVVGPFETDDHCDYWCACNEEKFGYMNVDYVEMWVTSDKPCHEPVQQLPW